MIRVIVTGTRYADESHRELIAAALRPYVGRGLGVLAHGAGRGVDTIAADLADVWGWQVKAVPARWQECDLTVPSDLGGCPDWSHRKTNRGGDYCPYAGLRRNQQLADLTPAANVVLAFPDGRKRSGTADMIHRAMRARLVVETHPLQIETDGVIK